MKEYKIKFMNDKEFEALSLVNPRYQNTKDDLGFADMVTNRIFVRRTGVSFVDQFTTLHEIEEILAKNSTHEDEYNIRHKKVFKEIIAPYVLPVVGALLGGPAGAALGAKIGIGPTIASAIGGAAGGAGASAIGAAGTGQPVKALPTLLAGAGGALTGAGMAPGITASKAAGGGFAGQTLSGAQSALGFQSGAQQALANQAIQSQIGTTAGQIGNVPVSGTLKGITSTIPEKIGTMGAGALGFGAGTLASAGNIPAAQTLGLTPSKTGVEAALPAGRDVSFGGQQYDFSRGLTTTPVTPKVGPEAALPAGVGTAGTGVGAGGIVAETAKQVSTKTPMLEKLLGANWRQTILGASIPLLGQSATSMFGDTPTPEPFTPEQSQLFQETANMVRQGAQVQLNPAQTQTITAQYDDALETARQNIMDRYKMLRPGSDIENDSNFREALIELENDFAEKKANALAGAQLGLGAQQTQMMSELAAMEIYTLAMKAGINYQEAKDFKDMLGSLGFMIAKSGQPIIYTNR